MLPIFLEKINSLVGKNIQETGWAAGTKNISMADVCLMTWLSTTIHNAFFRFHYEHDPDHYKKMLEKFPILDKYWTRNYPLIEDYIENRRENYLL